MSAITHLYAGVPVSDLDAGIDWYTRFFGKPPDFRAGEEVLWEIDERAWLFIEPDAKRAGTGRITLSVTGLDALLERLAAQRIEHEPIETYSNRVRHVNVPDPDGNAIAFAEPPDAASASPRSAGPVAGLHRTIPALPVRDVGAAVAYYRDRFGFDARHETGDFAVLARDDAVLHLWGASDEDWRSREDPDRQPVRSGAESFLAGTASCRIEVSDVDALFAELQSAGVLHDVSRAGVTATDFGTREFATLDADGNLLAFFRWNDG